VPEKLGEALRAVWIPLLAAALSAVAGGGIGVTIGEGDRSNQQELLQFVSGELAYREQLLAHCEGRPAWHSREVAAERVAEEPAAPAAPVLPSRSELRPLIEDLPKPVQKMIRRAAPKAKPSR